MSTELLVKLPVELQTFYDESGYLPSTPMEFRGNARLRVRSEADVEFVYLPHALADGPLLHRDQVGVALIKDLSKTGIGLLYHEQMYPEEQIIVNFQLRAIHVTCVRCRRIANQCYEIGGKVIAIESFCTEDEE